MVNGGDRLQDMMDAVPPELGGSPEIDTDDEDTVPDLNDLVAQSDSTPVYDRDTLVLDEIEVEDVE